MTATDSTDAKRIFIAVNAEVEPLRKVMDAQLSMRALARSRGLKITWVPAANFHVTVRFLGAVPAEVPGALRVMLRERLVDRRPFSFGLAGVGAFPAADKPRILWAGVEDGSGELARLASDVEGWVRELGFAADERPFRPHLTIGRVKEGGSAADLLAPHQSKSFGVSTVHEVVIYESRAQAQGVEYHALGRVGLGHGQRIDWPVSPAWLPGQPGVATEQSDD